MIKLGITGGIGSGKSIVSKFFETLEISVYYADDRAKYILQNDENCRAEIIKNFGEESYQNNGMPNTKYLAEKVFSSIENTEKINQIIHPLVASDYEKWLQEHKEKSVTLKEAALMYESGSSKNLDKIIVVDAPLELRIKRVLERDKHRNRKQIESIIAKQMSAEEKLKRADFVIINDEKNLVTKQVLKILEKLNIS